MSWILQSDGQTYKVLAPEQLDVAMKLWWIQGFPRNRAVDVWRGVWFDVAGIE